MKIFAALLLGAALAAAQPALANSFTNGGFETTTGFGQFNYGSPLSVSGWYVSNGGYTFLGDATTIGNGGVPNAQYGGNIDFWSSLNGGSGSFTASPNGGNFIISDGAYEVQPLNQDITGLQIGRTYNVSYYYGSAQQQGFTGDTTEAWLVSLGGGLGQASATLSNPNHSANFSGWHHGTASFVATSTAETLSFLAQGTPDGLPPFSLLDGVTVSGEVPEPAAWAMLLGGFGLVGFAARRRRSTAVAA